MTVDRNEVEQMAKFMNALSNPESVITSSSRKTNSNLNSSSSGDSIAEMKAILERFHGATNNVVSEATFDRPLRESLATEKTDYGARIGNWDIVVRHSGKRDYYDVVHVPSQETIVTDLLLYEAAHGLVRQLNDGGRLNSKEILDLLQAEQQYAGAVHDMVLYKHHLKNSPNSSKVGIYEARYGAAKRTAIAARDRVCKLSENL